MMDTTTAGPPMFMCGPTLGCGKLTPFERIASGWITPRRCQHCGKEWQRGSDSATMISADSLFTVNSLPVTDDERKAMLQLVTQFEHYPMATGLSHLVGLLIRDAAKGRQA